MIQIKDTQPNRSRRVSKQDWLATALDMLRTGGIEAVRVERLAAKLGVSKSGFYYHFKERQDLHAALLDYWLRLDEKPFSEERRLADASPDERLRIGAEAVDRSDLGRYDAAIRQWSRQDPKVRRVWRKEMNKRLEYVRCLFAALGFSGDDLEMRTRTFIAYQASERNLFTEMSAKDRARLRELRLRMLLGREG